MSALIGMLLSWVGIDLINGQTRFTFGIMELNDGVGVIPLVMGLFRHFRGIHGARKR